MSYTKLAKSILTSTIWMEDDQVRLVWMTMLAMADWNGEVAASIPGLAHAARVPIEACERAIAKFSAPDPYSRTKDHDGRRIEEVRGGWTILNHDQYRRLASKEDRKERDAERQKRKRDRLRTGVDDCGRVTPCHGKSTQAEAEAQAEPDTEADASGCAGSEGIASLPASAGRAGQEPPPLNEQARRARRLVEALAIVAKSPISLKNQKRAQKALATLVTTGRDPVAILNDLSGRAYEAKNPGGYLLAALESEAKSDAA